jgi:hypothetical protein
MGTLHEDITFLKNHAFLRVMWKNILELARQQMTKWHMGIACWMTKATDRHSEYVILIAFPLQQWFN